MDGWIIGADEGVRYALPEDVAEETGVDGYVVVRALTDAEALERESLGIEEWYYLDGQEPTVRRTYDLQRMAEYDYRHCVRDFCLPIRRSGEIEAVCMDEDPDRAVEILGAMPAKLAEWLGQCIAEVNMRTGAHRRTIEAAKKN